MIAEEGNVPAGYRVERWEFNVVLVEIIVFAGVAVGWGFGLGRRALGPGLVWPEAILVGAALLLLGLALYPVTRIWARNARAHQLRFGRWLLGALAGCAVAVVLYGLLS
jgi:hypothetical protein